MRGLLSFLETVDSVLGRVATAFSWLSSASVFGIVVLLVAASVRRYVFGAPLDLTEDLASLLFVSTAFMALAHGLYTGRHVRLEIFWARLPPMTRQWFDVLAGVLAIVMLVIVGRETAAYAIVSYELNSRSDNSGLLLWPWMALIPAGLGVLLLGTVLRTAIVFVKNCLGMRIAYGHTELGE